MCCRKLDIRVLHNANAECVYQWVTSIGFIKYNFATDIRKTKAIAISTDASDDARQYPMRSF